MIDKINNPQHYNKNGTAIECADYIQSHQMGYFEGNVIKYITRFKYKENSLDDLKKARWYIDRLIKIEEAKDVKKISLEELDLYKGI